MLYDIKSLDAVRHQKYTGVSNKLILANLRKVATKVKTWLRVPVITGVNTSKLEMESLADFATTFPIEQVSLLPLHHWAQSKYDRLDRSYLFKEVTVPEEALILQYKQIMESRGLKVIVSG